MRGAEITREKMSKPDASVPIQCGGYSSVPVIEPHSRPGISPKEGGGSTMRGVTAVGS